MFVPISPHPYHVLNPDKQLLVCTLAEPRTAAPVLEKWATKATAVFEFTPLDNLTDIIRDLLANPQIRAITFEGTGTGRAVFDAFWRDGAKSNMQGIAENHLQAVRQFVDLFDDDCDLLGPRQPFWPTRLKYEWPKGS